ncbi:hypothetical protein [Croceicoccus sp. Ery15]|uniref:hypothetical protein n=1 Tax=Croceicoccus sp. Ery15 TaxID=1703338 RepID=UPI001E5B475A|nr:hypothetical protein [Croceicoccus sp. Ery15]
MDILGRRTLLKGLGSTSVAAAAASDPALLEAARVPAGPESGQASIFAGSFGVIADGRTDAAGALQSAIDYALNGHGAPVVKLPAGEILLNSPVIVRGDATVRGDHNQIIIEGCGSGKNGSWLNFSDGSLIVSTPNHILRDFRVSSRRGNGIEIRSDKASSEFPTRGMMENIRAEYCGKSGITIEDSWVYSIVNCFARFNRHAGLEGRQGARTGLACNAISIFGGEFQGNGSKAASGPGTGAGIITGRCVQFTMIGGAVEGNLGDGVVLSEQLRGFAFTSVYFEKNGTHELNCDVTTDTQTDGQPHAANAPNSGLLANCNFTPQDNGGKPQQRAVDVLNVQDFRVINPQIFAQSKPVFYAKEPFRIRETQAGRCSGWVEGGYRSSVRYDQNIVCNETARYGFPRQHRICPEANAERGGGFHRTFCIPLPPDAGNRVEVKTLTRKSANSRKSAIEFAARFGPAEANWMKASEELESTDDLRPIVSERRFEAGSAQTKPGYVEVQVRLPENDNLQLMSVEILTYEAQVS